MAISIDHYRELSINQRPEVDDILFLQAMPREQLTQLFDLMAESKSQIRQDLFVLSTLGFKRDGFFVDFGATDGVAINNSWLLEKRFGWRGILAEPARAWHDRLRTNRDVPIETDCVWTTTGENLEFVEPSNGDISTLATFAGHDHFAKRRQDGQRYKVRTISLNDMLAKFNAPTEMDYLSIDTEGSELDILTALDHDRYSFRVITCEHNHTANRDRIHSILNGRGYRRVHEAISAVDDWYVR